MASMIETGTPSLELEFRNRSTLLSAYSCIRSGLLMCPSISQVRLVTSPSPLTSAWISSRIGPSPACRHTTCTSGSACAISRIAATMM